MYLDLFGFEVEVDEDFDITRGRGSRLLQPELGPRNTTDPKISDDAFHRIQSMLLVNAYVVA